MAKQLKQCKSFALDLMHLSTNEINEIKDLVGLKAHLAGCQGCREKLGKLKDVDVFSFLAKPRSAKYQTKIKELVERVRLESSKSKAAPRPACAPTDVGADRQPIDEEQHTGSAAGAIYRVLKTNGGEMPYPLIRQQTGLWNEPFYEAMGWLAREKKIRRSKDATTFYAALAASERPQARV